MKLIDIKPNATQMWSVVWNVYISSFPPHERRGVLSHENATKNQSFYSKVAIDESNNFLALLFYWRAEDIIYIEHLAVNPQNRGANIGTQIMKLFIEEHSGCTIILEIEPPVTEITQRRLNFYKKLGFRENKYEYTHPSYSRDIFTHNLEILSHPKELKQLEYDNFCNFITNVVLSYIE